MPIPENDPFENVFLIEESPTYQLRQRAAKARQVAEVREAMDQYYAENPDLEREKRKARIAAIGLKVVKDEVSLQENNPQ